LVFFRATKYTENYANQALCCKVLRRSNIPNSNLTKQQRRALRSLRRDKDIAILPAVKGNTTVVLDRSEYDEKMRALIGTPTYRKLTKDPTTTQETKLLKILRKLKVRVQWSGGSTKPCDLQQAAPR
jgi:hypothetical protein